MSYLEMRKALEAVHGDMEEIGHLSASTGKQVDDALKSEITVSELVDELRKRDGVDSYDVSVDSDSRIILYARGTEFVDTGTEKGAAIILRITDW